MKTIIKNKKLMIKRMMMGLRSLVIRVAEVDALAVVDLEKLK